MEKITLKSLLKEETNSPIHRPVSPCYGSPFDSCYNANQILIEKLERLQNGTKIEDYKQNK